MTAIHQFVPSLSSRDAIGSHALRVQALLRDAGFRSDFYVVASSLDSRPDVFPYAQFDEHRTDEPTFLLYQASTGSPMARFLAGRPEPKLVNYHNITPPEFFEPWEPTVATVLAEGLRQMEDLAPHTDLAIADSEFNEQDLLRLGYRNSTVVPILFDPMDLDVEPHAELDAQLHAARGEGTQWLFVGRVCPNKAQVDLVKAFAAYRAAYEPNARLHVVGGSSSHLYEVALEQFTHEIGCGDAVRFSGSVDAATLSAHYRNADVFVCVSQHEGFCVPLLEAMHFGVPVVALRSTAVPETLGGAGLVVPSADPALIAAAVDRVVSDSELRTAMIDRGRTRLAELSIAVHGPRFVDAVRAACGAR